MAVQLHFWINHICLHSTCILADNKSTFCTKDPFLKVQVHPLTSSTLLRILYLLPPLRVKNSVHGLQLQRTFFNTRRSPTSKISNSCIILRFLMSLYKYNYGWGGSLGHHNRSVLTWSEFAGAVKQRTVSWSLLPLSTWDPFLVVAKFHVVRVISIPCM